MGINSIIYLIKAISTNNSTYSFNYWINMVQILIFKEVNDEQEEKEEKITNKEQS